MSLKIKSKLTKKLKKNLKNKRKTNKKTIGGNYGKNGITVNHGRDKKWKVWQQQPPPENLKQELLNYMKTLELELPTEISQLRQSIDNIILLKKNTNSNNPNKNITVKNALLQPQLISEFINDSKSYINNSNNLVEQFMGFTDLLMMLDTYRTLTKHFKRMVKNPTELELKLREFFIKFSGFAFIIEKLLSKIGKQNESVNWKQFLEANLQTNRELFDLLKLKSTQQANQNAMENPLLAKNLQRTNSTNSGVGVDPFAGFNANYTGNHQTDVNENRLRQQLLNGYVPNNSTNL
jgi:hypothetical protein